MQHTGGAHAPVDTIRRRVKELRRRSGMTAAELAEQLDALGVPWNRSIVANFEGGRRPTVSVVEWLALARVLNVAPVHLLVPPDAEPNDPYQVTPVDTVHVKDARHWIRGYEPLSGSNRRDFHREEPREEQGRIWIPLSEEAYQELLRTFPLTSKGDDGVESR